MPCLLPAGSFFGTPTRTQDSIGFHFVEARFAAETHVPLHAHESASLYLVLDGACAAEYGKQSYYCEPASLVFHPAAHSHAGVWPHHGLCFNIEITPQRMAELQRYARLPVDSIEFAAGIPNQIALRLYREFQQPDAISALAMEGMMLELLAEVSRSALHPREPIPPRWLRIVVTLLEAHYRENLSLAEIASAADVHQSHLVRVFRQHYRCSIGDYVRRLRIEYICQQLTTAELSLGEIALEAGFADQSHFTKTFKRLQGITPAEYQRRFHRCAPGTTI